jgi:hypothetical protein
LRMEARMRVQSAPIREALAPADAADEREARGGCTAPAGSPSGSIGGLHQDISPAITTS